jgi:protein-L-isoaspartate(D-aspartate) O-methyltransferase
MDQDFSQQRQTMVRDQLMRRGISDEEVLAAMREVPRHLFVPEAIINFAYQDTSLPIGEDQTISQPYIVALMIQSAHVDRHSVVLEVGTGSGYAAAVLSRVVKEVHTIERVPALARRAESVLQALNYANVHIHEGDGSLGLSEYMPYDAIIVTASAPAVPQSFISQLKESGRVVIPVGDALSQQLLLLQKTGPDAYAKKLVELVRFVPLIGKEGW